MALGGNTLQAVSRADVQLVRTLFDAAQKAHGWHSVNDETILEHIWRMQKFLHDFMMFGIGGLVDSPTSQAVP